MPWSDVAKAALELLKNPTIGTLLLLLALVVYATPIGVMTFLHWDSTNRIVQAIQHMDDKLNGFVERLASRARHKELSE